MANNQKTLTLGTVRTLKVYERTMCRQSRYRHSTAYCPEIRLLGNGYSNRAFAARATQADHNACMVRRNRWRYYVK